MYNGDSVWTNPNELQFVATLTGLETQNKIFSKERRRYNISSSMVRVGHAFASFSHSLLHMFLDIVECSL